MQIQFFRLLNFGLKIATWYWPTYSYVENSLVRQFAAPKRQIADSAGNLVWFGNCSIFLGFLAIYADFVSAEIFSNFGYEKCTLRQSTNLESIWFEIDFDVGIVSFI